MVYSAARIDTVRLYGNIVVIVKDLLLNLRIHLNGGSKMKYQFDQRY
jgi:hypothetical protein